MNNKSPGFFLLFAAGIQLILWTCLFILLRFSFCPDPKISEVTAVAFTSVLMAGGGLGGMVFCTLGIYYTVLHKKGWTVLWLIFLGYIPLLFLSVTYFLAFLMLRSII